MSYDHNVYVGWYAEFDENDDKIPDGVEKIRQCPNSKKHSAKDKFCPSCGAEIVIIEKPLFKNFISALNLYHMAEDSDTTEQDVQEATFGHTHLEDLNEVTQDSSIIFPEFLDTDKIIIMAPGYTYVGDVGRSDGTVEEITNPKEPSQDWKDKIAKVFKPKNLVFKYGVVVEVM